MQKQLNKGTIEIIKSRLTDSVFLADLLIGTKLEGKMFDDNSMQEINETIKVSFEEASKVFSDY